MNVRSALRVLIVSILAGATIPALFVGVAHATTTAVNCPTDNLQTAINNASSGDTLDVTGHCDGNFFITKSLTLQGDGSTVLDGGGSHITVLIEQTPTLNLNDLTVTGGGGFHGEGMSLDGAATVTLTRVTVSGNTASDPDHAAGGGGISNDTGTLALVDSTVSGNTVTAPDAAGGGILTFGGTLSLTNSTVSGNTVTGTSSAEGGGIFELNSPTTLIDDTIAGNSVTADPSSGTAQGGGTFGVGTITATIISGNTASGHTSAGADCVGSLTSGGYNLFGNTSGCGPGFVSSDFQNVNPMLDSLKDNGGPTKTMGLLPGSPALNAIPLSSGSCSVGEATDQRGVARPQGVGCEIGAVEKAHTSVAVSSSDPTSTVGEDVTFTATVCPNPSSLPATPTGTVKFLDYHNHSHSVIASSVTLAPGGGTHCAQASTDTSSLSPGKHKIVARYGGNGGYFRHSGSTIQHVG